MGGRGEIVIELPAPKPAPPETVAAKPEPKPTKPSPKPKTPVLRDWTIGTTTIHAEFRGVIAGKVRLRRDDSQIVTVQADELSDADREWIRQRSQKR